MTRFDPDLIAERYLIDVDVVLPPSWAQDTIRKANEIYERGRGYGRTLDQVTTDCRRGFILEHGAVQGIGVTPLEFPTPADVYDEEFDLKIDLKLQVGRFWDIDLNKIYRSLDRHSLSGDIEVLLFGNFTDVVKERDGERRTRVSFTGACLTKPLFRDVGEANPRYIVLSEYADERLSRGDPRTHYLDMNKMVQDGVGVKR